MTQHVTTVSAATHPRAGTVNKRETVAVPLDDCLAGDCSTHSLVLT